MQSFAEVVLSHHKLEIFLKLILNWWLMMIMARSWRTTPRSVSLVAELSFGKVRHNCIKRWWWWLRCRWGLWWWWEVWSIRADCEEDDGEDGQDDDDDNFIILLHNGFVRGKALMRMKSMLVMMVEIYGGMLAGKWAFVRKSTSGQQVLGRDGMRKIRHPHRHRHDHRHHWRS